MKKYLFALLITGLILALGIGIVYGQSAGGYDLSWWSIDGGGGHISAGGYALDSAVGQPDASAPLAAGGYELTGGFLSGGPEAHKLFTPLIRK